MKPDPDLVCRLRSNLDREAAKTDKDEIVSMITGLGWPSFAGQG